VVAGYHDGVLMLTFPVAEQAKPRRIDVAHDKDSRVPGAGDDAKTISGTTAEETPAAGNA